MRKNLGFQGGRVIIYIIFCILLALMLVSLVAGILAFCKKKYIKGSLFLFPLIGFVIIIILPDLLRTRECSEITPPVAQMRGVQSGLELYYTHYKYYPENLGVPIKEGYIQEGGDKDPWNSPYKYERTPDKSNYLLGSAGEDKLFDTDDDVEPPINTIWHSYKRRIEVKK